MDLGNCTTKCTYDYFNLYLDKICECSINVKCQYCTEDSIKYDLCITCNTLKGYYPKYEDVISSESFINCYSTIENYYLQNKIFYPCYSTCKSCDGNGSDIDNNCTECKDGYEFKADSGSTRNCYEICSNYYYYDSENKYHCVDICPENYKLIIEKKKCIENCTKDDTYKFEYNNICYQKCPNRTNITNNNPFKCKFDLICQGDYYYNYENTECLDYIPDGFYCNSTNDRTIDKCHENCKTCNEGPTDNNHNCIECKSGYYFVLNNTNCFQNCSNYFYFDSSQRYHCTDSCPSDYSKLIVKKRRCIDNCMNDNLYKFEYENKCYSTCPNNTKLNENNVCVWTIPDSTEFSEQSELSELSEFSELSESSELSGFSEMLELPKLSELPKSIDFGELICPENFPLELINDRICTIYCNAKDIINLICRINNPKGKEIESNIIKYSIINGTLNEILINVTQKGDDIIINEKEIKYHITSTINQNNNQYNNISRLILGNCEKELKKKYSMQESDSLLIFKRDVIVEGFSSPIVEYEVFHPITKQQLNLSYCKNIPIEIEIPVNINEDELDKYNTSSKYYTDICTPATSENRTDIILSDRKNEYINKNLSLCEPDCIFSGYNSNAKKAKCECKVKISISNLSELKIDKQKLLKSFIDIKSKININVIKCYKLLFSKEGFLNNIGNYLLLSIIAYTFISSIIFYLNGFNLLKNKIEKMTNQLIKNINYENISNKNVVIYDKKNKKQKLIKNKNIKPYLQKKIKKSNSYRINPLTNPNSKNKINNSKNKGKQKMKTKFNSNLSLKVSFKQKNSEKKAKKEFFYNDTELNSLKYKDALKFDKRTYIQYYCSLIKKKQLLIFTFYPMNDYNSIIMKICLLLFSFVLYYIVNALFFNDSTMHKIYEDHGDFNIIYNIPQIIYSSCISVAIGIIVKKLSLSEDNVLTIKKEKAPNAINDRKKKVFKCLIIKFVLFFIICLLFLIIFWYYISCFCAVYKNTQYYLIKDTSISFSISLLYPFCLNILPGFLRIPSLNLNNRECMYQTSKIIQLI